MIVLFILACLLLGMAIACIFPLTLMQIPGVVDTFILYLRSKLR